MKKYEKYKQADQSWISSVPSHWEYVRAKRLFDNPKEKNIGNKESNILSLTLKGVINNDKDNPIGLSPSDYATYQIFKKDDLVFKLIDLENVSTSRVGIVPERGIMSSAYIRFSAREEINTRYFYMQYYDWWLRQIFNGLGAGVRQTLSAADLLNIKIVVPPREEQDQIVRYLDWQISKINHLIHGYQKQIKLFEERKKQIINATVINGLNNKELTFSGIDWMGNIPKTWELIRIRNNYELQNGISESGDFFEKGYPFVNYGDVYKNRILPTNVSGVANSNEQQQKTYSVKKGDIFFTRTSETLDEIGVASVCLCDVDKAVFSGFLIRARAKSDILMSEYVGYYLQSQCVRDFFTKEMNLVTRASLGQTLLKSLYVPVPPKEEQEKIIEYLNEVTRKYSKLIENTYKQINLLKEYRTRLISDVVTGQIDVRDVVIPEYTPEDDADTDELSDSEEVAENAK